MNNSQGGLEFRIKYHLIREGGWGVDLLGERKRFLEKMNGPLEEQMRGMIVCNKVFWGCHVNFSSPLLSYDRNQSFLVDETLREGI